MELNIGQKIKQLRKSKKLTLKEISDQTGLSISFLSQVELMKSSLTLESLKKISEVLNVNPSHFFSEPPKKSSHSIIVRGIEDERDLSITQFKYKDLSGNKSNLNFSPILVIINPGENKGNPFAHSGTEFLYVLEGELTVNLDNEEYNLKPHDSIIIDSEHPHYWLNHTEAMVKFLCISTEKS